MKIMIPPEVMAGIVRRFYWRSALSEISRNFVETVFDEHFFAVCTYGPYPTDSQTLSLTTVAKILDCSLSTAQYHIEEHRELIFLHGICRICRLASNELGNQLRMERKKAEGGGDLLVVPKNTSLMVIAPPVAKTVDVQDIHTLGPLGLVVPASPEG